MARHIKSIPKRISEVAPEVGISKELEDVVMRLLAKDPTERQASAEGLSGELLAAVESHGAGASGVRSSIANAAGIAVPDSRRPLPLLAPSPARRDGLPPAVLAVLVAVVVVVAAAAVYLGMKSGKATAAAPAESAASSASASASTAEAPAPLPSPAVVPATSETPPATASAEPPPRPQPPEHVDHIPARPHGRPAARPSRATTPPPPSPRTATPAPPPAASPPPSTTAAPSATSNYTVFD
jgi:hypothetical protein